MQLHTLKRAGRALDIEDQGVMHQQQFSHSALQALVNPEILIGVSSCLLGKNQRFDHQHNTDNAIIQSLGKHFVIRSIYPESEAGLGVIKQLPNQQNDWHSRLSGYLFKTSFPSRSTNACRVTNNDLANGKNNALNFPLFPAVEAHQLANPTLKYNFIQRVCVMHRWQQLAKEDTTIYPLIRFHKQHHHLFLSHDPDKAAEIEKILLLKNTINIDELHTMYIQAVNITLKRIPTRKNHACVMQQLLAVLKHYLTREDFQEIQQSIENYQLGRKSIKTPLTLLRYHAGIYPLPEISNSVYLFPYSQECILCQQNDLAIAM